MTIREYLFNNKVTAAQMARDLGLNPNYFRLINRGKARPGYELAMKIELYTGGQVTIQEIRNANE